MEVVGKKPNKRIYNKYLKKKNKTPYEKAYLEVYEGRLDNVIVNFFSNSKFDVGSSLHAIINKDSITIGFTDNGVLFYINMYNDYTRLEYMNEDDDSEHFSGEVYLSNNFSNDIEFMDLLEELINEAYSYRNKVREKSFREKDIKKNVNSKLIKKAFLNITISIMLRVGLLLIVGIPTVMLIIDFAHGLNENYWFNWLLMIFGVLVSLCTTITGAIPGIYLIPKFITYCVCKDDPVLEASGIVENAVGYEYNDKSRSHWMVPIVPISHIRLKIQGKKVLCVLPEPIFVANRSDKDRFIKGLIGLDLTLNYHKHSKILDSKSTKKIINVYRSLAK